MRPILPLVLLALAASATPALAQNEAALKRAFEGREVAMLIEMPASHRGIDLRPQREPEMDFSEYARRIKQYGVSLRKGDRTMVTLVKVNKKNIEFHLGAGGYGTWGDDSGSVHLPYVGKSDREKQLERDVKRESDAERKRRMERELASLKRERERDERERDQRQRELTAIKQNEIAVRRLDGGSRFNIWYDDKRLEQWAPTPEELMFTVAHYVEFTDGDGDGAPTTDGGGLMRPLAPMATNGGRHGPAALRRGMSSDEVRDALGSPTRRRESKQGDLLAVIETWETVDSVTEVTLVGGVVVKFSTSSK